MSLSEPVLSWRPTLPHTHLLIHTHMPFLSSEADVLQPTSALVSALNSWTEAGSQQPSNSKTEDPKGPIFFGGLILGQRKSRNIRNWKLSGSCDRRCQPSSNSINPASLWPWHRGSGELRIRHVSTRLLITLVKSRFFACVA